jgi:hypothetical protein
MQLYYASITPGMVAINGKQRKGGLESRSLGEMWSGVVELHVSPGVIEKAVLSFAFGHEKK